MKTIIPFLLADGGYCELRSGNPPRNVRTARAAAGDAAGDQEAEFRRIIS